MAEHESLIKKYIDEKKEFQKILLQLIEKSDLYDDDYHILLNYLDQYRENKSEIKYFLRLLSLISINHHRGHNFFKQIEKILTISSKYYKPLFSNDELYMIFLQSKPVLLILIKTNIITIDELIFKYLLNYFEMKDGEIHYYFYPELNSIIKLGTIEQINENKYKLQLNEDIKNFETNRQKFENVSKLCSIIREDLIDNFIEYVHKTNISLKCEIRRSLFETNPILIEKEPTLIEYATFFGSIQIIKYLEINGVELTPSLWLYAVHSNNSEVIQLLVEKEIEIDDRTFSEAIKCYHNDIAYYIYDNYLDSSIEITKMNDEVVSIIYSSNNYEFFSSEIDGDEFFFNLCLNEYTELINYYLTLKKDEIEKFLNENKELDQKQIIIKSLIEKRLDISYYLLLTNDCISKDYFQYCKNITKIALPPTIKTIENYGIYECSSLTHISIPSFVTSIGIFGLSYCSSLSQITIPSSVRTIGNNTFNGCKSLTKISFVSPSSLISIEEKTFAGCSSLLKITIPSSVKSIGSCSFQNCSSLQKVSFEYPSLTTYIDDYAFEGCNSLTEILFSIQSSLIEIRKYAFSGCSSLMQISIPSSVKKIGEAAFNSCSSLMQVSFNDQSFLVEIGQLSFYYCTSLTQISIPKSVTSIGSNAFSECESLMNISVPASVYSNVNGLDPDTIVTII